MRAKSVGNGEGAIVTIRRGGKIKGYAPEISLGYIDGKRKRKRGDIYKTRGEARTALTELKGQHESGADLLSKTPRVREYFPTWLAHFAKVGRGRSVDTYRWAIERVIIPRLGEFTLKKLSTFQLDLLFTDLLTGATGCRRMAAKSVTLVRTVLRQAFKQAMLWGIATRNPVTDTQSPKVARSSAKALTNAQAAAFLEAARGERLELALRLALSLGLRRGEVCGLRWEDIDLEAGTLAVNGSLGWIKGKGLVYGPPKTESGRRGFTLPAPLLTALRRYQLKALAERKAMQGVWTAPDQGYVFVAATTGGPLSPSRLYDVFHAVTKRAGVIGFRLHDLRHSCASFLHAEGIPVKTISAYLGHSDTRITNDVYVHLFPQALNDAASVLDQRLATAELAWAERAE